MCASTQRCGRRAEAGAAQLLELRWLEGGHRHRRRQRGSPTAPQKIRPSVGSCIPVRTPGAGPVRYAHRRTFPSPRSHAIFVGLWTTFAIVVGSIWFVLSVLEL